MTDARFYQIVCLLWLIIAATGDLEDWLDIVASGFALLMGFAYLIAMIWATFWGSKEGADG